MPGWSARDRCLAQPQLEPAEARVSDYSKDPPRRGVERLASGALVGHYDWPRLFTCRALTSSAVSLTVCQP